jgi:8-oxo-dGTP pyrophosphatase MutT (NUDIX family)
MEPTMDIRGVPVTLLSGMGAEKVSDFAPLEAFLGTLKADAGFEVSGAQVLHAEYFGLNPETAPIGFMMVRSNVKAKVPQKIAGATGSATEMVLKPVPSVVFLRGPAVDVFVVLRVSDGPEAGQEFFVGVRQPRVPRGKRAALELPAGMWKPKDGTYRMVAAAEALQEIGIRFGPEDLYDMSEIQAYEMQQALAGASGSTFGVIEEDLKEPFGVEPSIGGCDEIVRKFALRWSISSADLALLNGRLEGLAEEREHICTTLLPLKSDSALYYTDAKILSSLAIYAAAEARGCFQTRDRHVAAAGGPLAAIAAKRDGGFVQVRFHQSGDGKLTVEKL